MSASRENKSKKIVKSNKTLKDQIQPHPVTLKRYKDSSDENQRKIYANYAGAIAKLNSNNIKEAISQLSTILITLEGVGDPTKNDFIDRCHIKLLMMDCYKRLALANAFSNESNNITDSYLEKYAQLRDVVKIELLTIRDFKSKYSSDTQKYLEKISIQLTSQMVKKFERHENIIVNNIMGDINDRPKTARYFFDAIKTLKEYHRKYRYATTSLTEKADSNWSMPFARSLERMSAAFMNDIDQAVNKPEKVLPVLSNGISTNVKIIRYARIGIRLLDLAHQSRTEKPTNALVYLGKLYLNKCYFYLSIAQATTDFTIKKQSCAAIFDLENRIFHDKCNILSMPMPPTLATLEQLAIDGNAAYIRSGAELYYVNKNRNACIQVRCSPAQLVAFDAVAKPSANARTLTEEELTALGPILVDRHDEDTQDKSELITRQPSLMVAFDVYVKLAYETFIPIEEDQESKLKHEKQLRHILEEIAVHSVHYNPDTSNIESHHRLLILNVLECLKKPNKRSAEVSYKDADDGVMNDDTDNDVTDSEDEEIVLTRKKPAKTNRPAQAGPKKTLPGLNIENSDDGVAISERTPVTTQFLRKGSNLNTGSSPFIFSPRMFPSTSTSIKRITSLGASSSSYDEKTIQAFKKKLGGILQDWGISGTPSISSLAILLDSQTAKKKLSVNASKHGYSCIDVESDGNCFFHAVAHQLSQLSPAINHTHEQLRTAAIAEVTHYPTRYADFVTGGINGFVDRNIENGEWSDNVIIQALANAMRLSITIIRDDIDEPNVVRPTHGLAVLPGRDITLGYQAGVHYQSAVRNRVHDDAMQLSQPSNQESTLQRLSILATMGMHNTAARLGLDTTKSDEMDIDHRPR